MPDPDSTPNLGLPFLLPAQAQKHVTHNEALRSLDLVVQLAVQEFEAAVPPAAVQEGQIWALGAAPSGDWAGQGHRLAARLDGSWNFLSPGPGWRAWGIGDGSLRVWDGVAWVRPAGDHLPGLGIGTAHDATNRLAVAATASLFSHAGTDHRLKVNKAAAADTATLLFQSGWSGRAEMGLAGSDDFSVKVSADGATWTEALRIAAATGAASTPDGFQIGGQAAYHRGNLLGAVSQAAGLPGGAVLETGSNANGRYLRLACGTQLCWKEAALSQSVAASSYAEATWTYPAGFASAGLPVLTVTTRSYNDPAGRQNAARHLQGVGGGIGANTGVVGVWNGHGAALAARIDAIAAGRWF